MRLMLALSILVSISVLSAPALAYVGPGIGVGALGVLLGVLLSVLLALVSIFWYLPKRLLRKRKKGSTGTAEAAEAAKRDGNA